MRTPPAALRHAAARAAPGSVLFVCTSNALRSPMAEGLAKFLLRHTVFVDSAGVRRGALDGFAVAAMDEIGIDISGHRAKALDDLDDGSFDLIVALSPAAHHRALEFTRANAAESEFWNILDPSLTEGAREARLAAYRAARDALLTRIEARFERPGAPV